MGPSSRGLQTAPLANSSVLGAESVLVVRNRARPVSPVGESAAWQSWPRVRSEPAASGGFAQSGCGALSLADAPEAAAPCAGSARGPRFPSAFGRWQDAPVLCLFQH